MTYRCFFIGGRDIPASKLGFGSRAIIIRCRQSFSFDKPCRATQAFFRPLSHTQSRSLVLIFRSHTMSSYYAMVARKAHAYSISKRK